MSESEDAFLSRIRAERLSRMRKNSEAIRDAKGDCGAILCYDCPLKCSVVEDDNHVLAMAEEWLAANP